MQWQKYPPKYKSGQHLPAVRLSQRAKRVIIEVVERPTRPDSRNSGQDAFGQSAWTYHRATWVTFERLVVDATLEKIQRNVARHYNKDLKAN
jgi:hypothetical protein